VITVIGLQVGNPMAGASPDGDDLFWPGRGPMAESGPSIGEIYWVLQGGTLLTPRSSSWSICSSI